MKNLTRVLIVIVSVLLLTASFSTPVRASRSTDAEFIKFLEEAWVQAIVTRNVNVLDRVIADDFSGVSPNGERYTKQEAIADVQSGRYSVENMEMKDVKVRLLADDTAIVTYNQNETSTFGDEDCSGRYSFTDVWVNRNDDWYVVSSHGTPVNLP